MPKLKLTDHDRKIMYAVWNECPCITKAALARIFHLSPSRVSEVINEEDRKQK